MVQMFLFDLSESLGSTQPCVDPAPRDSRDDQQPAKQGQVGQDAVPGRFTGESSRQINPVGMQRMGDLAKVVIWRYEQVAKRRAKQAAKNGFVAPAIRPQRSDTSQYPMAMMQQAVPNS